MSAAPLVTDFIGRRADRSDGAEQYEFRFDNGWIVSVMRAGLTEGRGRETHGFPEGKWEVVFFQQSDNAIALVLTGGYLPVREHELYTHADPDSGEGLIVADNAKVNETLAAVSALPTADADPFEALAPLLGIGGIK